MHVINNDLLLYLSILTSIVMFTGHEKFTKFT